MARKPTEADLFAWAERYPHRPGHRDTDTSREAAEVIAGRASTLRNQAYAIIVGCQQRGATADEVAHAMRETVLAIRPRVTELGKLGLILDSGARRLNSSGRRAIVWVHPRHAAETRS